MLLIDPLISFDAISTEELNWCLEATSTVSMAGFD